MAQDRDRGRAGTGMCAAIAVPALAVLLCVTGVACTQQDTAPGPEAAGGPQSPMPHAHETAEDSHQEPYAPQVAVVTPGELLEVIGKHEDKPVVLKFWATWCVPCVEEMPKVIEFYRKHAGSETFGFVSVSADMIDAVEGTVIPFLTDRRVPFPVWVIDASSPDDIVTGLGLEETNWAGTLPATFVLDAAGGLSRQWIGIVPDGELEEALSALM